MKLSKFTHLVKRTGMCTVLHVSGDGVWLGTRAAFYKAAGMPNITGDAEVATVLDFDIKTREKIYIEHQYCEGTHNILGFDLTENAQLDIEASKMPMAAVWHGSVASALLCNDGELVFYDESYLAPLSDVFKESDYVSTVVRRTAKGTRYVVIKDGFEVLAAIMPMKIIGEDFLRDLATFEKRCIEQFSRDHAEGSYTVNEDGEIIEPGQISLTKTEGEV